MQLRDESGERYVEISPVGWEFPNAPYVVVEGRAHTPDLSWRWSDPSLNESEVLWLAGWLEALLKEDPIESRRRVTFDDPELGFELLNSDEATITLRVYLDSSAAPTPDEWDDDPFEMDLQMSREALGEATLDWRSEVSAILARRLT